MSAPKFCDLCGRSLRLVQSQAGFYWWECPKWPNRPEHWWQPATLIEHSRPEANREDRQPRFDRMTGQPIR